MVAVVLMGLLGYLLLPISALPPVDFPTIQVVAQYPGASPDVMASSVTTPPRTTIRPDQRPRHDDVGQRVWEYDHHAAI